VERHTQCSGKITTGATIIEPTSGKTGIALTLVCALKGYRMIAVVPEAVSSKRRMLIEKLGGRAEILEQMNGRLKAFVAACGAGSTFTGTAQVLKAARPGVRNIAVEPSGTAVLSGSAPGHHKIQDLGEGLFRK
jgi:cysteine synthase